MKIIYLIALMYFQTLAVSAQPEYNMRIHNIDGSSIYYNINDIKNIKVIKSADPPYLTIFCHKLNNIVKNIKTIDSMNIKYIKFYDSWYFQYYERNFPNQLILSYLDSLLFFPSNSLKLISVTPVTNYKNQIVTLSGIGFDSTRNNSYVSFNSTTATQYQSWSDMSINVIVPDSAKSGTITVTVGNKTSNAIPFTVAESSSLTANSPFVEWQKSIGGSEDDLLNYNFNTVQQTSDSGYIMVGSTFSNNGDVKGFLGGFMDIWLIKLTKKGTIQWQKCLGGSKPDGGYAVEITDDQGFIVCGNTNSSDGDVKDKHGKSSSVWIVKLDSAGNIIWEKNYGGSFAEGANAMGKTKDKGYVLGCWSLSNDGDMVGHYGNPGDSSDVRIIKIDSLANIQWQMNIGGTGEDVIQTISQTYDGGYIISVQSSSKNDDFNEHYGPISRLDVWIVKLDSVGNIQWKKIIGGTKNDYCHSVIQTKDGGYIATGYTTSHDGDFFDNKGLANGFVIKFDTNGNIEWKKCIGGSSYENLFNIIQTDDDNYVLAGYSSSNDGDVNFFHIAGAWVLKLDKSGNILWQNCYGDEHTCFDNIRPTFDDGFICNGIVFSDQTIGKFGYHGGIDIWVAKLKKK